MQSDDDDGLSRRLDGALDLWSRKKIQCVRHGAYSPILDPHRRPQMSHEKSEVFWLVPAIWSVRFASSDETRSASNCMIESRQHERHSVLFDVF